MGSRERVPGMGFLQAATILFRMAVAVAVTAFLGDWLDRVFHTAPWLLVAGMVAGVVIVIIDLERRASRERRKRRRGGGRDG